MFENYIKNPKVLVGFCIKSWKNWYFATVLYLFNLKCWALHSVQGTGTLAKSAEIRQAEAEQLITFKTTEEHYWFASCDNLDKLLKKWLWVASSREIFGGTYQGIICGKICFWSVVKRSL